MTYKNYTLHVHPTLKLFGSRVCFVKQDGLTITKVVGVTADKAIEAGKIWIDWRLSNE
jgi:hypothetical protein